MITIEYTRDKHRITVRGHANSGEAGHDLVCAAVSSLVYTIAAFVQNMSSSGQLKARSIKLKSGDARVSCSPMVKYRAGTVIVFDAICGGFELLARQYPNYIRYEMVGVDTIKG